MRPTDEPIPSSPRNHRSPGPAAVEGSAIHGVRGVVRGHAATALGILRERLAEPWTLSTLAQEVHLSRSQLVRAFDATVEMSPMTYLRKMRVERMSRLLTSTDLSIREAARAVGWTDAFYACRCFHAHYGISPTEFRRRQLPPPVR